MDAFDIVIIADMACRGDLGIRIAHEIQVNSTDGYTVGLVHAGGRGPRVHIHPAIHSETRRGNAKVLDPSINTRVRLLIAYPPFIRFPSFLNTLSVEKVLLILESLSECDPKKFYGELATLFGNVSWSATNPWLQEHLLNHHSDLPVEDFAWSSPLPQLNVRKAARPQKTVAVLSNAGGGGAIQSLLQSDDETLDRIEIIEIHCDRENSQPENNSLRKVYGLDHLAIDRLMSRFDLLVYHPPLQQLNHPDATIATALASRKSVILAPHLRRHYGDRAVYCEAEDLSVTLWKLLDEQQDSGERDPQISQKPAKDPYRSRIATLLPPRSLSGGRSVRQQGHVAPNTMLFITGEICDEMLTGMLAVARRAEKSCRPVFVTMVNSVHLIEAFGYEAVHISPRAQSSSPASAWRDWFRVELSQLIDTYNPRIVVVDKAPTPEATSAVLSRPDCKLALLSKGNRIEADDRPWFDLALAFGDLADTEGSLATQVARVDPVTLLDEDEMLARSAAIESLGLDPAKHTMLIRPRGRLKDASVITQVIARAAGIESLQIAVEWDRDNLLSALWPHGITMIRPTAAWYLNAFDLAVTTADYFTFHDSISHLLPTIFVTDPTGADRSGNKRVQHAEAGGAALEVSASSLNNILPMITVLLEERANEYMRSGCRKLRVGNGASAAAEALMRLLT